MLANFQMVGPDGVVSRRSGSTSLFYAFDPQGSAAAVLNAGAAVQGDELTEANGRHDGSYASPPVGFGGQWSYYTDAETGLSLLGHRYYDSGAGRFLTRDPIRYNGGVNLYGYTANDYENEGDPFGLDPKHTQPDAFNEQYWDNVFRQPNFLSGWILGLGPDHRLYSPNTAESKEMKNSSGGNDVRKQLAKQKYACGASGDVSGTMGIDAFKNSVHDKTNGTEWQVGSFSWTSVRKGNEVIISAYNEASFDSFWYHAPSLFGHDPLWNGKYDRSMIGFGPMGTIYQVFIWKETVPPAYR